MKAWHFVGSMLRDGRDVPTDGVWLEHPGKLVMCESGLHASRRIIDALSYARNDTICRVECGGAIIEDTDKLVCSRRKILWRVDGEGLLRQFARECALSVAHLWDMPDIVRRYLETGDESIRDLARCVAYENPRPAIAIVKSSQRAAWLHAWKAARAAAELDVCDAAYVAAWEAAFVAAWEATEAATWSNTWQAARERQNIRLGNMVRGKKNEA